MANSYGFSIPMCLLYFWPLVSPFSSDSFPVRLHEATLNWVIWLTCFTEIAFQIPHNLAVSTLKSNAGKLIEWYEPLSFFKRTHQQNKRKLVANPCFPHLLTQAVLHVRPERLEVVRLRRFQRWHRAGAGKRRVAHQCQRCHPRRPRPGRLCCAVARPAATPG